MDHAQLSAFLANLDRVRPPPFAFVVIEFIYGCVQGYLTHKKATSPLRPP